MFECREIVTTAVLAYKRAEVAIANFKYDRQSPTVLLQDLEYIHTVIRFVSTFILSWV